MSDQWKKYDRPCDPCPDCGAELYEKFWGNGGWVKTDKVTDKTHGSSDCVKVLKARIAAISGTKCKGCLMVRGTIDVTGYCVSCRALR